MSQESSLALTQGKIGQGQVRPECEENGEEEYGPLSLVAWVRQGHCDIPTYYTMEEIIPNSRFLFLISLEAHCLARDFGDYQVLDTTVCVGIEATKNAVRSMVVTNW